MKQSILMPLVELVGLFLEVLQKDICKLKSEDLL